LLSGKSHLLIIFKKQSPPGTSKSGEYDKTWAVRI
jgi:hypothetical protein